MMWKFSEATSVLPTSFFLIFLGIEVFYMTDLSIPPSSRVAENIIHTLTPGFWRPSMGRTCVFYLNTHGARAQPWCRPNTRASQCELPRCCHSLLSVAVGLIFNDLVQPRAGIHHLLCVARILVLHPSFGHCAEMTFYWSAWGCLHLATSTWCSKSLW